MFGTWLHRVWCTLASIVLGVPKLVGGSDKVGGARLSCKANQQGVKMKGSLRGDEGKEGILVDYLSEVY